MTDEKGRTTVNENYKCGIECLQKQIEEKLKDLRREAEAERKIAGERNWLQKELNDLPEKVKQLEKDGALWGETLGTLFSYGGETARNPFEREAERLKAGSEALLAELNRMPKENPQALRDAEAAVRRYTAGADAVADYLKTGKRPGDAYGNGETASVPAGKAPQGSNPRQSAAGPLTEEDDILGYACRIISPAWKKDADFCEAFLRSPEYNGIPEGRDKRCLDGILIENLCKSDARKVERWVKLPLCWDPDCQVGDDFASVCRLREKGLLTVKLLSLQISAGREDLLKYLNELAAGRIPAEADEIMRPKAREALRKLLNPERQKFFEDVDRIGQWTNTETFRDYRAVMEEELSRRETKQRITALLNMTFETLARKKSFGETEDEKSFVRTLTGKYFDGTLKAYLEEPHPEWRVTASEVWSAVCGSPKAYAEEEARLKRLRDKEPEAVFHYFESGMYAADQNTVRQSLVMRGLREMLTSESAACAEYVERLGQWKGERDFAPYEKLILSLETEEPFRRSLRKSLVRLYRDAFLRKELSNEGNRRAMSKEMAELYMENCLNLRTGSWAVKSGALSLTPSENVRKMIGEEQQRAVEEKQKAIEEKQKEDRKKERNRKLHRLRNGENVSEEDVWWYFDNEMETMKPDRGMIRVIGGKLTELLSAKPPASDQALKRLKKWKEHPNFQPFAGTVEEALQKNNAQIRSFYISELSRAFEPKLKGNGAERKRAAEGIARRYIGTYFGGYMRKWSDSAEVTGNALKWLAAPTVQNIVREEEAKAQGKPPQNSQTPPQRQTPPNPPQKPEQQRKVKQEKNRTSLRARIRKRAEGEKSPVYFDYVDLLIVLAGGTHMLLFLLCLFAVEVKAALKCAGGFWKKTGYLALRGGLMMIAALIFRITGGYTLFESQMFFGWYGEYGVISYSVGAVIFFMVQAALVGYIPALLAAYLITTVKKKLGHGAGNGGNGGQRK